MAASGRAVTLPEWEAALTRVGSASAAFRAAVATAG